MSSDELGDVLRLAANACRCGGVVGIISDSGYLKESRESKEIHERELINHTVNQVSCTNSRLISSISSRWSSDELGNILRLAANACRRSDVAGVIPDSEQLEEFEKNLKIGPMSHAVSQPTLSSISYDESSDVFRLATNACWCCGVAELPFDPEYLEEFGESKEILEIELMSHALGQTSSTSSIESDEILRLAANACRCGSMARIPSYPEQFEDESLLVPLSQELDDLLLLGANSFRQRVLLSITVLEQDILADYVGSGVAHTSPPTSASLPSSNRGKLLAPLSEPDVSVGRLSE